MLKQTSKEYVVSFRIMGTKDIVEEWTETVRGTGTTTQQVNGTDTIVVQNTNVYENKSWNKTEVYTDRQEDTSGNHLATTKHTVNGTTSVSGSGGSNGYNQSMTENKTERYDQTKNETVTYTKTTKDVYTVLMESCVAFDFARITQSFPRSRALLDEIKDYAVSEGINEADIEDIVILGVWIF